MDHQAHQAGHPSTAPHEDRAAGHGMLVVGLDTTFFYHLPMFMSPHDYQVILQGTLSQQGSDPQRTYTEDRQSHLQTRVYTLSPVPFVLPDVFPPAAKRKNFQGDLFRGHFESPPEYPENPFEIGSAVDVAISRVVFVQKLLPPPAAPKHLEYLLFGKGSELFLAHLITKRGDFDHIVSADIKGHRFSDDELQRGIRVQFSGKANTAANRLAEGKTISGSARVSDKDVAVEVEPRVEFYMSERDLT
jgi:hypothetical protein